MTDIQITLHIEADRLANAIELLAAAILGTPASKAEGTQFQLQPVRGHEGADPAPAVAVLEQQAAEPAVPPAAAGPTMEQVRALMAEKSKAGKTDAIKALLKKRGVSALKDVKPTEYAALVAEVEAL